MHLPPNTVQRDEVDNGKGVKAQIARRWAVKKPSEGVTDGGGWAGGGGQGGGGHQLDAAIRGVLAVLPAGGARTTSTPFARMGGLTWCEVTVSKGGVEHRASVAVGRGALETAASIGALTPTQVKSTPGSRFFRAIVAQQAKIDSWLTFSSGKIVLIANLILTRPTPPPTGQGGTRAGGRLGAAARRSVFPINYEHPGGVHTDAHAARGEN